MCVWEEIGDKLEQVMLQNIVKTKGTQREDAKERWHLANRYKRIHIRRHDFSSFEGKRVI